MLASAIRTSDRGATGTFETLPRVLAGPRGNKEWYLCAARAGLLIGVASHRRFAGTVNLIGSGRDEAHEGRSHEGLCPRGHAGDLGPGLEGLGPGGSILAGGAGVAAGGGHSVGIIGGGEEALSLAG